MSPAVDPTAKSAQVVLDCAELQPTLRFFTTRLGFRVDAIFPADAPTTAVLSGHGLTVRLQPGAGDSTMLRLACVDPIALGGGESMMTAPNGTRIELVEADPTLTLPPIQQSFVVARVADSNSWGTGRAGMQYRDIIPGRQGGRFIGSHIRIAEDGPVPDYVHFHKVRFQMIYCHRGWAQLVYQDQGPPFIMRAGDCVLQPPEIRHRVLESGDGLEVIELGCPAEHETLADHSLSLPTAGFDPHRNFGGQRFVRHVAATATWHRWQHWGDGFECRDLGIGAATDGLAGVRVIRPTSASQTERSIHDGEFWFGFVLSGSTQIDCGDGPRVNLAAGDTVVVPAGEPFRLGECSSDLEVLHVTLPETPLLRAV
jgi:mannose-6-phosphate isomerase-like protein (cupin superfamily)